MENIFNVKIITHSSMQEELVLLLTLEYYLYFCMLCFHVKNVDIMCNFITNLKKSSLIIPTKILEVFIISSI